MPSTPYAFVTLITSDSYLPGALALVAALKDVHPHPSVPPEVDFQTVCLITPESVDVSTIKLLRRAFDVVVGVEIIEQEDDKGLKLLGRLDLSTVLTKLHIFRLTQYKKIIFLDADILPVQPLSHLFSLPYEFSAVPDVGWPDIFNSGMLVLSPGEGKFSQLMELLKSKGSWDGGDQGLLNEWRGDDWNRLSFIYNTTPTAAYTYAPAYERYGSKISALHFIGPNKPWNSVTTRSPFQGPSQESDDPSGPQRAYDYDSLVDKWYDVYDRHYRSHTVAPETNFELKRYVAAWDKDGNAGLSGASSGDVGTKGGGGSSLGLDDLRRIAVEGMGSSLAGTTGDRIGDEGEYKSMPLEGRVDLMRPKKEEPVIVKDKETEDRKGPPQLFLRESSDDEQEAADSFTTPVRQTVGLIAPINTGVSPMRWTTLPTPRPDEIPSAPHLRAMSLPPTPTPITRFGHQSEGSDDKGQPEEVYGEHEHEQPRESPQHLGPGSQPQEHHETTYHHHEPARRPHSPPLLSWNPAIEPPPSVTPLASAFPSNTYFPNVWDKPRHEDTGSHNTSGVSALTDTIEFFDPPPLSNIPETLISQGHYRNVTGEEFHGSTPSPDRAKVKRVFPWEEKPRHLPGRVFPTSDAPSPEAFVIPETPPPLPASVPSTPERATLQYPVLTPSPLTGLPFNLTYANAWDTVPSIQKYANRLVRPAQPAQATAMLAPAFRPWEDRVEASSRDGDDEDNADESEGGDDGIVWEDDSDRGSGNSMLLRRSRTGSLSSAKGKQTRYRDRGVQTIPRETRDQGVQVAVAVPTTMSPTEQGKRPRQASNGNQRHWSPIPVIVREMGAEQEPATPLTSRPSLPPLSSPAGIHSPQYSPLLSTVSSPTVVFSPKSKPSPETASPTRKTLTESPTTSASPVTPVRKAGRVWDPARGVELFKRGSEGVLARFLKMGSWEDDAPATHTERH